MRDEPDVKPSDWLPPGAAPARSPPSADPKRPEVQPPRGGCANWGLWGLAGFVVLFAIGTMNSGKPAKNSGQKSLSASSAASSPAIDATEMKSRIKQWAGTTSATMKPCDDAIGVMAKAMSAADRFGGYNAARSAEQICRSAWSDARDAELPAGLNDKAQATAEKAREACELAMLNKQTAAENAAEMLDSGDMRPSNVSEFTDLTRSAQAATLACAGGMLSVAVDQGVGVEGIFDK